MPYEQHLSDINRRLARIEQHLLDNEESHEHKAQPDGVAIALLTIGQKMVWVEEQLLHIERWIEAHGPLSEVKIEDVMAYDQVHQTVEHARQTMHALIAEVGHLPGVAEESQRKKHEQRKYAGAAPA